MRVHCWEYDAFYDDQTSEWLEVQCEDPECQFCINRPETHDKNCPCTKELK